MPSARSRRLRHRRDVWYTTTTSTCPATTSAMRRWYPGRARPRRALRALSVWIPASAHPRAPTAHLASSICRETPASSPRLSDEILAYTAARTVLREALVVIRGLYPGHTPVRHFLNRGLSGLSSSGDHDV